MDTILFGTGFTATEFLAPMDVEGRAGHTLAQEWAHGAEAYLGITVPGFPNMFLLYGPNTNHGTGSAIELIEAQARYGADAVKLLADGAARAARGPPRGPRCLRAQAPRTVGRQRLGNLLELVRNGGGGA